MCAVFVCMCVMCGYVYVCVQSGTCMNLMHYYLQSVLAKRFDASTQSLDLSDMFHDESTYLFVDFGCVTFFFLDHS